jgi:hypothetical protein
MHPLLFAAAAFMESEHLPAAASRWTTNFGCWGEEEVEKRAAVSLQPRQKEEKISC